VSRLIRRQREPSSRMPRMLRSNRLLQNEERHRCKRIQQGRLEARSLGYQHGGSPRYRTTLPMVRIRFWLEKRQKLPNVMVRYSSDSIHGQYDPELHGSSVAPLVLLDVTERKVCKACTRDHECGKCRDCWGKSVPMIIYPTHGRKMNRIVAKSLTRELEF